MKKSPISRANIVYFETLTCIKMLVIRCLCSIELIQNDTHTNVKVYDNLLKINKDRIIIESELYSDYSKISSPIFELRCSLNENEKAEILKKSLIRSDFLKISTF